MSELSMIREFGWKRVRHLITPGRKERERAALKVVQAAATNLIETPMTTSGLNLRQMERVMSIGLKVKYQDYIMFGPKLKDGELDRLINDTASVRAEFPHMFEPASFSHTEEDVERTVEAAQ